MGAVPNSMENLVSSTAASGTSNAPANRTRVTLTITAIVIAVVVIAGAAYRRNTSSRNARTSTMAARRSACVPPSI